MSQTPLPPGWKIQKLSDVCEVILGQSPPGDTYNQEGDGLPFFQGKAEFGEMYPTAVKWCSAPTKIAHENDVLLSVRAPVGPTNLADQTCCIGRGLAALRAKDGIDHKYILYGVRATADVLAAKATGSTFSAVSGAVVRNHELPIPPIDEQKEIVAEIETQFARLDDAVAALQRTRTRLKRYRASVLQAAISGTLLSDSDASSWPVEPLGNHIERIQAGKNFRCVERPPSFGEAGLVKISAVTWGDYNELESKTCSDVSLLKPELLIKGGDFLISRANTIELVGACVIAKRATLPVMLSDKVLRIVFQGSTDKRWVLYFLRSPRGRAEIESRASGSQASMRNIGQQGIKSIPIPVPSLAEQERIVEEVERRLSVIDQMGATVETNLKRAESLRQSISRQAFKGRLVRREVGV